MKKIIALVALLLPTFSIFANHIYSTQPEPGVIHTTFFQTAGKKITGNAYLYLGTGQKDTCSKDVQLIIQDFLFSDISRITLNGKDLAQSYGVRFTCAQEVFKTTTGRSQFTTSISYSLVNDGTVYTKAEPAESWVTMSSL